MRLETKYGVVEGTVEEFKALLEAEGSTVCFKYGKPMSVRDLRLELQEEEAVPDSMFEVAIEDVKTMFGRTILKKGTVLMKDSGGRVSVDTLGYPHPRKYASEIDPDLNVQLIHRFSEYEVKEDLLVDEKLIESTLRSFRG